VPPTDYDKDNAEHVRIIEAAVEAQAELRAELKEVQNDYLDYAVKDFREVHNLFKTEDGVSIADYLDSQESIEKGARSSAKQTYGEWKALVEVNRNRRYNQ